MAIRVYECGKEETEALKKALEYDPYTDSSVIPSAPRVADKPADKLTEEEKKELEEYDKKIKEVREKLAKDPKAQVIFARQSCNLKDGASLGLDSNKMYLYIEAADDFFPKAEERFKNEFKTVKRAEKHDEDIVIEAIKKEEENAGAGFGAIFGG